MEQPLFVEFADDLRHIDACGILPEDEPHNFRLFFVHLHFLVCDIVPVRYLASAELSLSPAFSESAEYLLRKFRRIVFRYADIDVF